jgi:hypothetical protein
MGHKIKFDKPITFGKLRDTFRDISILEKKSDNKYLVSYEGILFELLQKGNNKILEIKLIDDNQNNREVLLDIAKTLVEDSEITFQPVNY